MSILFVDQLNLKFYIATSMIASDNKGNTIHIYH